MLQYFMKGSSKNPKYLYRQIKERILFSVKKDGGYSYRTWVFKIMVFYGRNIKGKNKWILKKK